jgi:L-alanine-DL-glutamate epimerase-like enolase superfamily enzyme
MELEEDGDAVPGGTLAVKIARIDVDVVDVPYIEPVRTVGWANPPFVVVQVRTDDGLVGLGERWTADRHQVEAEGEAFIGQDPLKLRLETLDAPFQSALYDLAAQALGLPVWRLIGDQHRDRVPVAYWSCHMPPEETAREAARAAAAGFAVHKLKARSWDIVRQAELITRAAGPDLAIRVDPNTEFRDVAVAVKLARQLAPYNVECYEDPVLKHDYRWTRLVREKTDVPQALHLQHARDALAAVSAGAVDRLNVSGNVAEVLRVHAVCAAAGIRMWHQIAGLSLGIQAAFAVHVGCTLEMATLPSDELPFIHENDLIGGALPAEDGHFTVPAGPGLGIQLDQAALNHYRID